MKWFSCTCPRPVQKSSQPVQHVVNWDVSYRHLSCLSLLKIPVFLCNTVQRLHGAYTRGCAPACLGDACLARWWLIDLSALRDSSELVQPHWAGFIVLWNKNFLSSMQPRIQQAWKRCWIHHSEGWDLYLGFEQENPNDSLLYFTMLYYQYVYPVHLMWGHKRAGTIK